MDQIYPALTVATADGVAEVTLTRPALLNCIDEQAHADLISALTRLHQSDAVRAIVLASTGRHFSAGGDLDEVARIQADPAVRLRVERNGRALLNCLLELRLPVVVALQGDAHGLGATIILACDAIVAQRRAKLSDAHVLVGMVAGDGGCVVWPQTVGMLWARRHLLTGKPITAEEGYSRGLVTDLVDTPEQVLPAARSIATHIAGLAPLAVQGTKQALNRLAQHRASEVFEYALALEMTSLMSEDVREAVLAFREKRPPIYHGR